MDASETAGLSQASQELREPPVQAAEAVTSSSASDTGAEAPVTGAATEVTLLEAAPGVAVLLADTVPDGWEIVPFSLGERANTEITNAVSNVAGALNLVAQGAQGLVSAQGAGAARAGDSAQPAHHEYDRQGWLQPQAS